MVFSGAIIAAEMCPTRPSAKTYNLLYAKSSNRCVFPGCANPITVNKTLVGNACHIKAANPGGPRYDPNQTNEERHGYDNLLLMCSMHNKVIDDDVTTYTVERLRQMKADHEAQSTPMEEDDVVIAVGLLVSGDGTMTTQARDITVTAMNPQNSVIAGVYQNIVHNYESNSGARPQASSSKTPNFVFVFGAPLGDNNSATWIMTLRHFGPGPAHNCAVDFYDKDRININHGWLVKHPNTPFAPPDLVGEFRHHTQVSEAGPEAPLPLFKWTPLDPNRQHYSVSISSRDGAFAQDWEITRVNGRLRSRITIARGPQWVEKHPNADPMVFKLEDPEFVSAPLLSEVPQSSGANVHPGWKPKHRFEVPVAIIDSNGNLQVMAAAKALDGSMVNDFGSWNLLTRHFGDDPL
jgi:hypothetical protein